MYKLGLSSAGKGFGDELFAAYKEAGIEAMEISLPKFGCDTFDYMSARKYADKYGIELWSFHLPFMPFAGVDISNPEICGSTLDYLENIIKKASEAGIHRFIVHPSAEPIPDETRQLRLDTSKESLYKLAQIGKREGAVICVEDLPRTCIGHDSKEILYLLDADDSLRSCLDTNHLLTEDLPHYIEAVGDRIITTHISDYDFINERHWLPGEGGIDWQAVVEALEKINYKGPWLYEVGFKAPDTITRCRNLNCNDFVRNAKAVFENKLSEFVID